jgi:transglutaminase-like putative cysteine protease
VAAPRKGTGFIEMVRRANVPPPPEHSVTFRVATAVAVLTGILACAAVGEVSFFSAVLACAGTVVGMVFSYVTHDKPWQWVKLLLAIAVLGVFASFVLQIVGAAHAGQLSSIEVPLAGLFTWVQVIHSFDVPARRDLLFSLAAAGALLTVGAAQAVSVGFLGYVVIWLGACLVGLGCSWRSMTGGVGPLALGSIAATGLVVVLLGAGFLVFLPAPRAGQSITLPSSLTSYLPLSDPGGITGSGSQSTEPAQAGKSSGRTGVGGFLGFANQLDTATRGALGNEVVMRVRADRPGYFLGMTYDTWDGQSWKRSPATSRFKTLNTGSPFDVSSALASFPQLQSQLGGGAAPDLIGDGGPDSIAFDFEPANVQTFYIDQPLANLLFATSQPTEVYFPEHSLIVGGDGSIRSTIAMTPGTVYTVISADNEEPASVLKTIHSEQDGIPAALQPDLQLPNPYQRVAALARQIVTTAGAKTTYTKVTALEAWMGRHVRYSTDIPPLLPGQDAVDQFLFRSRVGYCEQISTSLAVMLRTLGVPAREAIGYVPGPFDPLSDLYEIQAKDAHAWVQVWFPGVGWQSFDPTAQVPLAPPDPGSVLLSDVGHALAGLPWVPIGAGLGAMACAALVAVAIRRRRRLPTGWVEQVTAELERRGAAAGLRRRSAETLGEYAARLASLGQWRAGPTATGSLGAAAGLLERAAYGAYAPDARTRTFVEDIVRGLHPARGTRRAARHRLTTA